MGLDLYCDDEHTRMGSYSYVHVQRKALLEAYILYLRESKPEGATEYDQALLSVKNRRLANNLETAICKDDEDNINYHLLAKLEEEMHPGIFVFVYHSDCDGVWSARDAAHILAALHFLRPYFSRIPKLFQECENNAYYLERILRISVAEGSEIRFC